MSTPPKYNVATIEAVILELVAELHPRPVMAEELAREVICDPDDEREKAAFEQAIRRLREVGLFGDGDDKVVEPTPAGLRAVAVLKPPATARTRRTSTARAAVKGAASGPRRG